MWWDPTKSSQGAFQLVIMDETFYPCHLEEGMTVAGSEEEGAESKFRCRGRKKRE
jgi:hypothetical protein